MCIRDRNNSDLMDRSYKSPSSSLQYSHTPHDPRPFSPPRTPSQPLYQDNLPRASPSNPPRRHPLTQSRYYDSPGPGLPPPLVNLLTRLRNYSGQIQRYNDTQKETLYKSLNRLREAFARECNQLQAYFEQEQDDRLYEINSLAKKLDKQVSQKMSTDPLPYLKDEPPLPNDVPLHSTEDQNLDQFFHSNPSVSRDTYDSLVSLLRDPYNRKVNEGFVDYLVDSEIPNFFRYLSPNLLSQANPSKASRMPEERARGISWDNRAATVPSLDFVKTSFERLISIRSDSRLVCLVAINSLFIATGSANGKVRVWQASTGKCVRVCDGHLKSVHSLCTLKLPSSRGHMKTMLLSGSGDPNVILWDLDEELESVVFEGFRDSVVSLLDLNDGNTFIAGSLDGVLTIYDSAQRRILATVSCAAAITQLVLSSDKKCFFSADQSNTISIWNLIYSSKGLVERIVLHRKINETSRLTSIGLGLNSDLLFTASEDKTVKVWKNLAAGTDRTNGGHSPDLVIDGFPSDLSDFVLLSNPDGVNLILGILRNSSSLVLKHPRDNYMHNYILSDATLNANYLLSQYRLQLMPSDSVSSGNPNMIHLIAINQKEGDARLSCWTISLTRHP
eukprot:TRINITY_DN12135_c0_g1_i1.p1 TRINITY_DN12135_c0_g1~~TRINITY_DN12135_c0_g1_i1.p1  ORF type:complete len:616 (-),score=91.83 TRINITY_DN12135_c0_g1_i1:95-1942(-)